jgi:hypothetical protein
MTAGFSALRAASEAKPTRLSKVSHAIWRNTMSGFGLMERDLHICALSNGSRALTYPSSPADTINHAFETYPGSILASDVTTSRGDAPFFRGPLKSLLPLPSTGAFLGTGRNEAHASLEWSSHYFCF